MGTTPHSLLRLHSEALMLTMPVMRSEREVLASATPGAIATATTWELYALIGELVVLVEQMREMTAARAPIEQAKGIIMALHEVDEQAAFDVLRRRSQTTNVKLRDVAVAVLQEQSKAQQGTTGGARSDVGAGLGAARRTQTRAPRHAAETRGTTSVGAP